MATSPLSVADADDGLREPIAQSWRRATAMGLDPTSALDGLTYTDVDRAGSLFAAASPVLSDLTDRLASTTYSTLLVDREGRVAHRWCADGAARRTFDRLGVDVGASLLEEVVGTNAPGTVLETRQSITIHGGEHFAVPLRSFSCYGHPIFHPTTRRIEGVLDLSAMVAEAHPLLPALVSRAVADIEERLLAGSRVSDQQLLAAFQVAGVRRKAVVAIGHDLVMSNQVALDLVGPADVALLRMIASEARDGSVVDFRLGSGVDVKVRVQRVGQSRGGALLEIEPHERARLHPLTIARESSSVAPVLVSGPPGSGRSTRALEAAQVQPVTVLQAATALLDGPEAWAKDFGTLTAAGQGTVCVEGFELLPEHLLELLSRHVATKAAPGLVLVGGAAEGLTGRAAALAADCLEKIELVPLVNRLPELPTLAEQILRAMDVEEGLHLTPGALQALSCHTWPGNLRELRSVLEHAASRRRTGGILVSDLPERYRSQEPTRAMAPIERAERDAIVAALKEHEGNKVRTAEALGISRTTLYAKMRSLRITTY